MKWLFALWLGLGLGQVQAQTFALADLNRQLQQTQTVAGNFVQERHLASLAQPMRTEGRFVLQPKQALLWQLHKPFRQQLRIRSDGVWQWQNGRWQLQSGGAQARQMRLFLDLLDGNTSRLQQQFDLHLSGQPAQWQLTLTPKTALMKQIFRDIHIQGDQAVRSVTLSEAQGDKTVMRFQNVRPNPALNAEERRALAP